MSATPFSAGLLACVLAVGAVVVARGLLAYVKWREPEEAGASLPPRGAALLAAAVIVAVLSLLRDHPLTPATGAGALWVAALAVIFTVDLRVRYILDVFTVPIALAAVGAAAALGSPPLPEALGGAAIGLVVFAVFYGLGLVLFRRPAIGLGDVKLALLLGLMVGAARIVTAITIAAFLGGIVSLLLVATRRAKLGDAPPYGTYLAVGGYAVLLQAAGWWH